MDVNLKQLAETRIAAVTRLVEGALKAQPSTNVVSLTGELLVQFASHDCAGVVDDMPYTRKAMESSTERKSFKQELEVSREPVPVVIIEAPFPDSVMGGDSYDPIELTACLPDFDRLPTEFVPKFSAIRTGDKTVVINAAHYADLLQARDAAVRAREEAEVMKAAAVAAIQPLSDIETICGQSESKSLTLFGNSDGTFSIVSGQLCESGPSVRQLVRSIAEKITNPIPQVADEATDQSGVQEVSCSTEPACETEECQTKPVDSQGQTGASQDTTEPTSKQF